MAFSPPIHGLDLHITDVCNLNCQWCIQAMPKIENKVTVSLRELEAASKLLQGLDLREVRVSGGEPTLHPEFAEISANMRQLFPAMRYGLNTNGCQLEKHLASLAFYDDIDVSHYPGDNDAVIQQLTRLKAEPAPNTGRIETIPQPFANVRITNKLPWLRDYRRAKGCLDTWKTCPFARHATLYDGWLWRCCTARGVSIWRNLPRAAIAVEMKEDWQAEFAKLDLSVVCRMCAN